jgi:glycosyltransferase involved in cell wall biosynthesis
MSSAASRQFRFGFVSTFAWGTWGGSEELWCGTAARLRQRGHGVAVNVSAVQFGARQVRELAGMGCAVASRRSGKLLDRLSRRLGVSEHRWLNALATDLVVISQAGNLDGVEWMLACRKRGIPYVALCEGAAEFGWPDDPLAEDARLGYTGAAACCFVSETNLRLTERQLACDLPSARVVRNPFKVRFDADVPWPTEDVLRFACVARLEAKAKGQDLIFQVLAREKWRRRPVEVTLCGSGPNERAFRRLVANSGLSARVTFAGHVDEIERVWASHHALLLPSRMEGLPLALVEAALCGRPAVVTDVGGNREVVVDGETGFVCDAATVALLDGALERAFSRARDLREMGAKAAARARTLFPPDPCDTFATALCAECDRLKLG